MLLKTILNRVTKLKGFVFAEITWRDDEKSSLRVQVNARANSKATCSGCAKRRPTYDRLPERLFQFVPLWQIPVFFAYAMRRVDCPRCGVTVELVPWATGKSPLTNIYRWFLAGWAKRLCWMDVAGIFGTTWQTVCRSVEMAVTWGLENRVLRGIRAIGVDEISWRKGQDHYLTLVYQIDEGAKRLLWIGLERTKECFEGFFDFLGKRACGHLKFICSDMWQPYLDVIAKKAKLSVNILDRFHIMARLNKAIDEVRADEARRLKAEGREQVLKHSRWCLLKRPENLSKAQTVKMTELLRYNLKAVKSHLHREDFQRFWTYMKPWTAKKFLREWCTRVMRSRITPMKKMALSIRNHEKLILNWFKASGRLSSGVVEGFNNKAKLAMRKSYGFRSERIVQLVLYHNLGNLPEPQHTHRFW